MSDRPRPYIPLSVRAQVAERQMIAAGVDPSPWSLYASGVRLRLMLHTMFGNAPAQLDHDPALILRDHNESTGKYTPDANDPRYLIYREGAEHLQKTTGRKPGATHTITTKGSDIGLKTKFAKLERPARRKQKIPGRKAPWPKKRKLPNARF